MPSQPSLAYRIATKADGSLVHEFLLNHFRNSEPITQAVEATQEDVYDFFGEIRDCGLEHERYSILAFEGNELVAICLNSVKQLQKSDGDMITPFNPHIDYAKAIAAGPFKSHNANRVATFVEMMDEDLPILLGAPSKVFKIEVICVNKSHMGKGIAGKLLRMSLDLARENDCDWALAACTAVASQGLMTKFHFRTIREHPFSCYREDGLPVFRNLVDGGRCGKLMALKINDDDDEDLK